MHDLHTIEKINAEAFGPAITNLQKQGKHVVATYAGLHILSIESFSDPYDATKAYVAPVASPDEHRRLFTPVASAVGANPAQRDQSEDRSPSEIDPPRFQKDRPAPGLYLESGAFIPASEIAKVETLNRPE